MLNKKLISILVLVFLSLFALAHEFWLQPIKFVHKPGESLTVNFKEGGDFLGQPWSFTKGNIAKLELHQKNTVSDLRKNVVEGTKNNLQAPLTMEGTYLLVLQSGDTFEESEAEKFNEYLRSYELDDAIAQREKLNAADRAGREVYTRYSKLLIQAGSKTDNTFRKEVGLPVEIIPAQNPYSLKVGDPVQYKILFQGKPLFGAKVRVWNFYNNRTTVQNIYSQQDGMISTHISNPGSWMVSFVKMVSSKDPKAEWQSHWASLVFGIK
jgi:uncharacterized GH25 family protein